ncbi:MAG: hypothetical protein HOP19_23735 [Acidobacteria bacterium]|nr:hypothetical protein [Acidobacteriota bacterium]
MKHQDEAAVTLADSATALKNWGITLLAAIFVLLYGAALMGWIKPLSDDQAVKRLEPIIFAIVGYYFGRLPAQQTEKTLKGEIERQTQKADAAQHAKEQALQAREALEEKIKNVRVSLTSSAEVGAVAFSSAEPAEGAAALAQIESLRQKIAMATNLLNV